MSTEYEKCLAGEPFVGGKDPDLLRMIRRARKLLRQLNAVDYEDTKEKERLMRELFGHVGKGVHLEIDFHCELGCNIFLGDNVVINMNCTFIDNHRIEIGSNVLIAPNVQIYTGTHSTRLSERLVAEEIDGEGLCRTIAHPIKIEDGVWIGGGAILLPGVTIGRNSIIGAGSVVTLSIPPDCIAVGNPCRVIRKLSD